MNQGGSSKNLKVLKYEVRDGKRVICDPAKITVPQNLKIEDVVAKIIRRLNLPQEAFIFQMQSGSYVHTHLPVSTLSSEDTYVLMAARLTPAMTEYDKGNKGFFGWTKSRTTLLTVPSFTIPDLPPLVILERLSAPLIMGITLGLDIFEGITIEIPEELDGGARQVWNEVRKGEIEVDWSKASHKLISIITLLRMLLKHQRPFVMWNPFISPLPKLDYDLVHYSDQDLAFWGSFFVFLWKLSAKVPLDLVISVFATDICFIENPLGVSESEKKSVRELIEYAVINSATLFLRGTKKDLRTKTEEQLHLDASLKAGEQVTLSVDGKLGYHVESVTFDCKIHVTQCSLIIVPRDYGFTVQRIPLLCIREVKAIKSTIIQIMCRDVRKICLSPTHNFKEVFEAVRAHVNNVPGYDSIPDMMPALYKQRNKTENSPIWTAQPATQIRYDHAEELSRFDTQASFSWRVTKVNRKREAWPFYPTVLAVPNWKSLSDETLKTIATWYPKWPIPTLMWRHPKNYSPLLWGNFVYNEAIGLGSQEAMADAITTTGIGGKKLVAHLFESLEKVLKAFVLVGTSDPGFPGVKHYPFATMNTTLRKDHMQVRDFCIANFNPLATPPDSTDNAVWREFAAGADWLGLVNLHLRLAVTCADVLKADSPYPVMFECTASMDSQYVLMAVIQVMEDPYFRTLKGFVLLIEKMFLDFGYPLLTSLIGSNSLKTAPSFILFMDCVHQLLHQNPRSFEITQASLQRLMDAYLSGHLVPFKASTAKHNLASLWDFMKSDYQFPQFFNHAYSPGEGVVFNDNRDDMVFWVEYFLKDLTINYNQKASNIVAKNTTLSLSLGRMSISVLPEQVFELKELSELNISNNLLSALPQDLHRLTQLRNLYAQNNIIRCLFPNPVYDYLKILNLSFNAITSFPPSITSLAQLRVLDIKSNKIVKFPDIDMPNLQFLDISHNKLTNFNVEKCTNLQYLQLAFNSIEQISPSLSLLQSLTYLNINNNKLTDFSVDLRQLSLLTTLNLSCNRIGNLPYEIHYLKSLSEMNMNHNAIRVLPDSVAFMTSLETLLLGDNKLTVLPIFLGLLTRLEHLDVRWDIIRDPPPQVVAQGLAYVMDYLSDAMHSSQVVERYKLMVVGKENVGKTSLLNILTENKQTNGTLLSTDGVSLCEFHLTPLDKARNPISVQALDFAGQSLYYDTHQFFIQQSAVYFIVWSLLDGEKNSKLEYWIRSIAARTKNVAPIVLVATHLDKVDFEFGETVAAALKDKYSSMFPNIVDSVAVSCMSDRNIADLKTKLRNLVAGRSNQIVQNSILLLESVLVAEREKRFPPLIEWPEFTELAVLCGVPEKDVVQAAELLHSMGNIYYLKTTPIPLAPILPLKHNEQFIIVNHQWLADTFATLITTKHTLFKHGIIMHKDLPLIWKPPLYPPQVHQVLLELLTRFDLVFTFTERNTPSAHKGEQCSLIPALLPANPPPEFANEWNPATQSEEKGDKNEDEIDYSKIVLKKVYRFDFIPSGFFCRFTVRVLRTAPAVLYWRNGVLVKDASNASSPRKVLALVEDDRMSISISAMHFNSIDLYCNIVEIFDSLVSEFCATCAPVIVCPHCAASNINPPFVFDFRMCKAVVLNGQNHVVCPVSGNRRIRIDAIVPEIAFTTNVRKIHISELKITSEIGTGAFATVYKGTWHKNHKQVAIKQIIDIDGSHHATGMEDLRHELFVMTQLSHPYLVKCYGICLSPLSIVSEFMTLGDLRHCINDPACAFLTLPNILLFSIQMASAIFYMHSQTPPICHRDLKSPNCLITQDSDTKQYLCKITDFGLARKTGLQFVGSKVDNPVWLAPEVVRKEPYGLAADVYSFGVILWEMYVKKPFFGDLAFIYEIEDRVQAGHRPDIPPDCPPDYANLIRDCWAQDPKSRPTFGDVVQRLHDIIMQRGSENPNFAPIVETADAIMEYHAASTHHRSTYWYRQNRGVIGGECKATMPLSDVTCMISAENGNLVICGTSDGFVTLINPQARKVLRKVSLHTQAVTSLMWIPKFDESIYVTPPPNSEGDEEIDSPRGSSILLGPGPSKSDSGPIPLSMSPPSGTPASPPEAPRQNGDAKNPSAQPFHYTTPRPLSTPTTLSSSSSNDPSLPSPPAYDSLRTQPTTDTRSHPTFLRRDARSLSATSESPPEVPPPSQPEPIRARASFIASSNFGASPTPSSSPSSGPNSGPNPSSISRSRSIQILNNNQRTSASASAAAAGSPPPLSSPPSSPPSSSLSVSLPSSSFMPNSPPKNGNLGSDPQFSTSPPRTPTSPTLLAANNAFLSPIKNIVSGIRAKSDTNQRTDYLTLFKRKKRIPVKRSRFFMKARRIRSNALGGAPINAPLTRNRRHPSLHQQSIPYASPGSLSFPLPSTKGLLCSCSVSEKCMKVWEVDLEQKNGHNVQLLTEIEEHAVCCFVMVEKSLWAGCANRDILIFDPSDWDVYTVVRVKESVTALIFIETVHEVWAATPTRILCFNPQTKQSSVISVGESTTAMVTVGNKVWSCGKDGTIKVWDVQAKMCHYTIITGLTSNISQMLVIGEFVWCASESMVVYHSETYESVIELNQHKEKIVQMVLVPSFLSNNVPELWSASADKTIKIWTSVQNIK